MKARSQTKWTVAAIGVLCLVIASCGSLVVQPGEPGTQEQPGVPPPAGGQVQTTQPPSLAAGVPSVSPTAAPPGGSGTAVAPGASPRISQACRGGATDVGVTASSIKIAQIVSITGPLPGAFNNAIDAVDSYFKRVNENGGICGRRIQLLVEDDAADPTTNRIKAEKLVREDKVFGFVGSFAIGDEGMASVINKFKVPDIGFPLSWDRGLSRYVFGVPGKTNRRITVQGKYGSVYLNRLNGIKQIALFWTDTETSFVNAWSAEAGMLKGAGGALRICHEQETSTTDVNFNQYVLRMAGSCNPANGPIGVYTTMENNANIRLARAMRDQGFQWKVFAPSTTSYDPSFISDAQGATEGAYVAVPNIPFERYPNHPELKLFIDTVKRYHPNAKFTAFGAYMWGAAALFTKVASECGGTLTRACVTPKLQRMGPYSDNGFLAPNEPRAVHLFQCDLLTQIRNGRFVELAKPAGAKGPPGGEEFWDCGPLLDWFQYYCTHKRQFPSLADRDSYVKGFVKNC